jgi:hypothetical protein
MLYREYGLTGKQVSLVGFGGMRFKEIDRRDRGVEMIREAARAGINYFDTAPAYFGTRSEETFGQGFQELKRLGLPFYCATKTMKGSEKEVRAEAEAQLRRLKVEAIDFYHVWCVIDLPSWQERKGKGVVQAFRRLKEEGLIRHICVSTHMVGDDIRTLLEEEVFEGVLFGYSAANFSFRQQAFEAIAARSLGCAVMNPLAGGVIPQNPGIFDFLRTRPEQSATEAALHFLFAHPRISTALVGFGTLEEVRQAVRAVDTWRPIDPQEVERIKARLSPAFRELCTGCRYCEPCPQGVPVSRLMEAYNHRKLYGADKALLERLRWHWSLPASAARGCTACGQCEEECTQRLPIIDRLAQIASLARKR